MTFTWRATPTCVRSTSSFTWYPTTQSSATTSTPVILLSWVWGTSWRQPRSLTSPQSRFHCSSPLRWANKWQLPGKDLNITLNSYVFYSSHQILEYSRVQLTARRITRPSDNRPFFRLTRRQVIWDPAVLGGWVRRLSGRPVNEWVTRYPGRLSGPYCNTLFNLFRII